MAKKKTYKLWIHMEEIREGHEPRSMDDEEMPDEAGEYATLEAAQEAKAKIADTYGQNKID